MRTIGFLRARARSASRPAARLLALAAAGAGLLAPCVASAALTGDFADALDVDASFLTGANGATDIAFAGDGRAVITTKTGNIVIRQTDGTKKTITGTFPDLDSGSEKGLNGIVSDPRDPKGFFAASRLQMQNKDIIYVANAGSVEISKVLQFVRIGVATVREMHGLDVEVN